MKTFVIEREIAGIGGMSGDELAGAARASCDALAALAPKVQWQHSYITGDKTFCIYLAEDAGVIRDHAKASGFPADVITEVKTVIDPTTAD